MDHGLDPGQRLPAAEGFQSLAEIGDVSPQKRNRRLGVRGFRRGHQVDVQHLVTAFGQVADDGPAGLAAASGHGDLGHAHSLAHTATSCLPGSDRSLAPGRLRAATHSDGLHGYTEDVLLGLRPSS